MRAFLHGASGGSIGALTISPNDARVQFTDYAGSLTRNSGFSRIIRSIDSGSGDNYKYAAPGARGRFRVTMATAGQIIIKLGYTSLITRLDTYNDIGSVYVDGSLQGDFNCPISHTLGQPHPVANIGYAVPLGVGTFLIEFTLPYCASVDFLGLTIPADATISSPTTRTAERGVFIGDSIPHGFTSSKARASWASLVAATEDAQILNLGYGGRQCVSGDGTIAGALACDWAVLLVGYNDFYAQMPLSTFKTNYKAMLTNYRAAATAAGRPNSKLYAVNLLWTSNSDTLTPDNYRTQISDAVSEVADSNVTLVSGTSGGMPSGSGNFPDAIHPNDAGSVTIASVLSAAIA